MADALDFVIIGAGPAGEAAAFEARRRGASVAIVDRRWVGGSCPHIGCVPSKSLLDSAARHHANASAWSWRQTSDRRDWMINRAPDAAEPDDATHVKALEEAGAVVYRGTRARRPARRRRDPPRRRGPSGGRPERRHRRRLGLEGAPAPGPRADPGAGRIARRPSLASCPAACWCSAAARPAASSPRRTSGSACRSRSSSRATG